MIGADKSLKSTIVVDEEPASFTKL